MFVLVELPLPWPSDIGDDPLISAIEAAAKEAAGVGRAVRLQAVAPESHSPTRRVIVFSAGDGPFCGYGRLEGRGTPDELVRIAASLVATEPAEQPADRVTDVLICTHGSRDTCCGSLGTRLWRDAEANDIRVWRTSHTGGHRFAPTAVTFPDGNYWAFLDAPLLSTIVDRSVPAEVAVPHLRGCAAFAQTHQVADGVALAAHGWEWLSCSRAAREKGSGCAVEIRFTSPSGETGTYEVHLAEGRVMPVPECGRDAALASKSQPEWHVTQIRGRST